MLVSISLLLAATVTGGRGLSALRIARVAPFVGDVLARLKSGRGGGEPEPFATARRAVAADARWLASAGEVSSPGWDAP
jgi:hypothetical protein